LSLGFKAKFLMRFATYHSTGELNHIKTHAPRVFPHQYMYQILPTFFDLIKLLMIVNAVQDVLKCIF